jgi:hypothetical protein
VVRIAAVPEWVRDTSGTALKTTDWMLDEGLALITENALLRLQIEGLKAELMVAVDAALVNR